MKKAEKCAHDGCEFPPTLINGYCIRHAISFGFMCNVADCMRIYPENTTAAHWRCAEHAVESPTRVSKLCKAPGCANPHLPKRSFCMRHKCVKDKCIALRHLKSKFCAEHKCILKCHYGKAGKYKYCSMHVCVVGGCEHRKKPELHFCGHHSCGFIRADGVPCNQREDCIIHTCPAYQCRVRSEGMCSEHKCRVRGCAERRLPEYETCEPHSNCYGCMKTDNSPTNAVHNLRGCVIHRHCPQCVSATNASKYFSLVPKCAKKCCVDVTGRLYQYSMTKHKTQQPFKTCVWHNRIAFYTFLAALKHNAIWVPRDVLAIILRYVA